MSSDEAQDTAAEYIKTFGILDSQELERLRISRRASGGRPILEISTASRRSLLAVGFSRHYVKKILNQDLYLPEEFILPPGICSMYNIF